MHIGYIVRIGNIVPIGANFMFVTCKNVLIGNILRIGRNNSVKKRFRKFLGFYIVIMEEKCAEKK